MPAALLKKRLWHRCFLVNFAKILRTPFLQNTSARLLLGNYSSKYVNFIIIGDLNFKPTESAVRASCQIYGCKNLVKDNTCFENPKKPSCIDLIITSRPNCFQNSVTLETGLSDFHKMILTIMKAFYIKTKAKYYHILQLQTFFEWDIYDWFSE